MSGLKDCQPPARNKNQQSSEKIDYFSELIIYASILAIAEHPDYVEEYHVRDSEALLFTANDYKDLASSKIYNDLKSIGGNVSLLTLILEDYLSHKDIQKLKPFDFTLALSQIVWIGFVLYALYKLFIFAL